MVCGPGAGGGLGRTKEGDRRTKFTSAFGSLGRRKGGHFAALFRVKDAQRPRFGRNSFAGNRWSAGSLWLQVSRLSLLFVAVTTVTTVTTVVAVVAVIATVTVTVTANTHCNCHCHSHCHSHFCHYSCSSSVVVPQVTLMPIILVTPRVPNCQLITLPPRKLLLLF
ncbi:hypothetical protein SAMN02744102_01865 [Paenibacillus barengoltzii]|nr:hypothetical protein SAMN02744102_01865 [Paenibacillus barengoltzii]